MTSLADDLYGDDDTPDPDTHDLEALNVLTRRLNGARKRLEAVRAPYTAELRRIAEREEWATAPLLARVHDLEMQVHYVAIGLLERDPKVKSWKLPHATIQTTRRQPEILVEDEKALIAWAKDAAPELLYEVPKVDKRAVKTRLTILPDERTVVTPAGETVPGVVVKPEQVSVSVREATLDDVEPM